MTEAQLTPEAFAARTNVSRETLSRLTAYADTLIHFQKTLNLVGPATLADMWRRHFLDSAQLFDLLPEAPAPLTLLDLGSGAGFPGLVLAVMAAGAGRHLDLHMIDSDTRKCAFLREAARAAGVTPTVHNARIEAVAPFSVDVISARALAPVARIFELCEGFLEVGPVRPSFLLLKGRSGREELTEAANRWKMQADTRPSITDPDAIVLSVKEVTRG
jgi:16S rRNA (guanine527-N7)-methyltransferase